MLRPPQVLTVAASGMIDGVLVARCICEEANYSVMHE